MAVKILNRWILSVSQKEREIFIDELFTVLEASEAGTLSDLFRNRGRAAGKMIKALRSMGRERQKKLWEIGRALLTAGWEVAAEHRSGRKKDYLHKFRIGE